MKVAGNLFFAEDHERGREISCHYCRTSDGSGQGTECEPVRYQNGGAWFCNAVHRLVFWGGSEGEPRNAVLPEVYAEDFSAAVDFLGTRPFDRPE